ncbi:ATP-binding sensor histidine kinase [Nostoc sp. WHI]|uniref:ATP-binding sensor histidine kinase n=1 Tax=Nostoc sp. WHI TaxID=2650611 RepID=UPI0018C76687|nr:ATP-binding sensor histidine kinase [Nostoc sp. WHI]MBG1265601.1 AAA family ATPase [Nostoc sp. WHI]
MNVPVDTTVVIPGYHLIEQLYTGSKTVVYRGIRQTDKLAVVVKLLNREYPTISELLQFRNQYTIAKNLDITGTIQPYTLEFYRNSYALVMEDFGGISLRDYFPTQPLALTEFLAIALQLADILNHLHHHQVIHKDIKPANILIHPQTKQVKIIDFSIASLLPKETQEIKNPNVLEGTLAYLSPEQTGRMNRGVDYRTDFYSLGVTFYELLTGELPFSSKDPMELVHCHIAKQPDKFKIQNSKFKNGELIPQVICDIVIKLMAKNAEDRYQSALGLKHDLENCLTQVKETGKIVYFPIAQWDLCDRFIIPEKLYGREHEVQTLLAAFERVTNHQTEIMLVAGFSGIGKTAIVNEVHKPIVRQRGYFIKGKFDQFNRNIPFSAFVQAFRDLMMQLLTENDKQLQEWKSKILEAVGENGQVIIEVTPELEQIIGQQSAVPELSGNAAQNRFNLLFQKFIQVFTTKKHPLVIFLDDLQWADSASLNLMQLLMSESASGYLLLIGAYRDNEVSAAHPLMFTLEEIRKAKTTINTITLAPLSLSSLNQLVADTLSCFLETAQPLTQLVYQKSKGNPFFSTQFLKALYEDKLIVFNTKEGYWQCDIAALKALSITDDVVEFMALQLQKLPEATQNVLKLAACIGNQFDLANLAMISKQSELETASDLWRALQEGFILPQSEIYKFYVGRETQELKPDSQIVIYKFLHDRVQQAAYSLIPEEQKQVTHLRIGQLLLQNTPATLQEDNIFEIVNQLNVGVSLIFEQTERNELAQLNLIAGKKATAATAYVAALRYLNLGIELLAADSWQTHYDLTLTLYVKASETAYLSTNFEQIDRFAEEVIKYAKTLLDKVKVFEVKILFYAAENQLQESANIGLKFLRLLGVTFPEQPTLVDIQNGLAETSVNLQEINVERLIALPEMTTPENLAAMQILTSVAPVVFKTFPALYPLIVFTQVNLSIKYGNASFSAFAYVGYGLILCGVVQDIDSGYKFGQLANQLLFKLNIPELKAKINSMNCGYIKHWKEHLKITLSILQSAYQSGLETGDLEFAAYSGFFQCCHSYYMGKELTETNRNIASYSHAIHKLRQENPFSWNEMYRQLILNLLGESTNLCYLQGEAYDEKLLLPIITQANDRLGLHIFYSNKVTLCYLFGEYLLALENAEKAGQYLDGVIGMFAVPIFHFYDSLVRLALLTDLANSERDVLLNQVTANQEKMKKWAVYAPMNLLHKYHLVEAEKHRFLGQKTEAIELFDRAISLAKENEYIQEEALANELAAKFYLDWGKEKVAQVYMQEAYYCYARWGAKAKVNHLEKTYPQLLQSILQQQRINFNPLETISSGVISSCTHASNIGSTNISDTLDFTSVLKAAQAISSSLELDPLITSLTRIILENSGAKKSVLVLPLEGTWQVKAITFINYEEIQTILSSQSLDYCPDIPIKIINYVKNSQQTVIINNCKTDIPGLIGEYMLEHQPQSVLCTPIINQGHLVGILYLENSLTQGVFTSDRLSVINLLSSQAAISLENARLYQQAGQAQLQIIQSEKMSALGNLVAGVAHEMNNPLGFISASLQLVKPMIADICQHLKLYQETVPSPDEKIIDHAESIDLDYSLADLPKIIDAMVMACDRLKNISTGLRTFSRADKDYKVPFNIHEGIDSTILILKHRLKANEQRPDINVITEYGDLPQIECFPGQLNQVFMNILANAIDALEESNNGRSFKEIQANPNRIIIKTILKDHQIQVVIADNAMGMTEQVKQKIFDHLFTTKSVGKGTGLGLAIARQIVVEEHGGQISVQSEVGKGTEFAIAIGV